MPVRRQTGQIKRRAPNQRPRVGALQRLQAELLLPRANETIDGVCRAIDLRNRYIFEWFKSPVCSTGRPTPLVIRGQPRLPKDDEYIV